MAALIKADDRWKVLIGPAEQAVTDAQKATLAELRKWSSQRRRELHLDDGGAAADATTAPSTRPAGL